MHFVGPDQLHGFEQRLTTDVYPADLDWTPDWRAPLTERLPWYHTMESVLTPGVCAASMQMDYDDEVCPPRGPQAARPRARSRRTAVLPLRLVHQPARPVGAAAALLGALRPGGDRAARGRADPARAGRSAQRPAARHVGDRRRGADRRAGAPRAPRLLRGDQLRRRAHRRGARRARGVRPARRHDRALHGRPRRDAGRARALVQDGLLRAVRARAADRLGARPHRAGPRRRAGLAARPRADAARAVRAREPTARSTGAASRPRSRATRWPPPTWRSSTSPRGSTRRP